MVKDVRGASRLFRYAIVLGGRIPWADLLDSGSVIAYKLPLLVFSARPVAQLVSIALKMRVSVVQITPDLPPSRCCF